jgi:hypothetical protein
VFITRISLLHIIENKPPLGNPDDECAAAAATYGCGKEKMPELTDKIVNQAKGDGTVVRRIS